MRVLEKCISVLGMRFKDRVQGSGVTGQRKTKLLLNLLYCTVLIALSINTYCYAELLDRVVAVVNNAVILLSELQDAVDKSKAAGDERSESEILEELINRTLLLEQALKFRVEMETYILDETEARKLTDDYINKRIKAFIHVPFEEIENYYLSHRDEFGDRDLHEAWDDIESRLRGERLQIKIDDHISQLRKQAYIRVQLEHE